MKQYNLGIIINNKKILKRIRKFLKGKGIDWKSVGTIFIYENREPKKKEAFIQIGNVDFKKMEGGSFSLLEIFPEGWYPKSWWSSLFSWLSA